MADILSTLPVFIPPLPLTQEEVVDDNTSLYLGKNIGGILSNITYKRMNSLNYAVLKQQPLKPLIFRGLFLVDDSFSFLTFAGNITSPFVAKAPEYAKYSGFLTAVPSGCHDYTWARQDWATVCHNIESIQEIVTKSCQFQTASSCVHRQAHRDLVKITLPMFKNNAARLKRGDAPACTFEDWPKKSTAIPLFDRVSDMKNWDIIPLPVMEYDDCSWNPVAPDEYDQLTGSLIDLEFNIAYSPVSVKTPQNNPQGNGSSPVPRPFDGNRQNGRKLTFWAVPTAIRILETGVGADMEDLPLLKTGKRRASSPLQGKVKRVAMGSGGMMPGPPVAPSVGTPSNTAPEPSIGTPSEDLAIDSAGPSTASSPSTGDLQTCEA